MHKLGTTKDVWLAQVM